MLKPFAQRLGTAVGFIGQLVMTILVGWLAWFCYGQYTEEHRYGQISTEGQRLTVRIDQVDRNSQRWMDQLTNAVYITFTHGHKPYQLRYKQDSGWLSSGDRIELFYHAGLDEFRQPRAHAFFRNNPNHSRLIGFTIVNQWNDERKWLMATLLLGCICVMLACAVLATLTGMRALRSLGSFVFIGMLLTGVAYFTYNTYRYYQYHNELQKGGHEETVQVLTTSRRAVSKRSSWFYTYEATVVQEKQERLIPIDEAEYHKLKPGDPLQVFYNPKLNDMMSVNHTPDNTNLIATLFAWVLLIFFSWQQWNKWRKGTARP